MNKCSDDQSISVPIRLSTPMVASAEAPPSWPFAVDVAVLQKAIRVALVQLWRSDLESSGGLLSIVT